MTKEEKNNTVVEWSREHILEAMRHGRRYTNDQGYVLLWIGHNHPEEHCGYIREHVACAELAINKVLPPLAEVHHFSSDRADNTNSNLVICEDHAYHMLLHARQRALERHGDPSRTTNRLNQNRARNSKAKQRMAARFTFVTERHLYPSKGVIVRAIRCDGCGYTLGVDRAIGSVNAKRSLIRDHWLAEHCEAS